VNKIYESLFPQGDPHLEMGMSKPPFPYRDGSVTNPYQYTICSHLGIVLKSKHQSPKGNSFHMGIPISISGSLYGNGETDKKITIWGIPVPKYYLCPFGD
jgi:hypothetical protein